LRRLVAVVALSALTIGTPLAVAHGVRHSVSEGATVVAATSDRNGCFAFLPDTNGTWKVTVDDGMGHLAEARIDIDSAGGRHAEEAHQADRLSGAVVGISVIFGCFGVYAMLSGRAKRRRGGEKTGA